MWGIDPSVVLVLIPIVFVGIIAIAAIGSLDEKTRGDRIAKFFGIASNAAIFFTVLALLYQVIDSQQDANQQAYAQLLDDYSRIDELSRDHPEIFRVIYPAEEYNRVTNEERLALQYTYAVLNFFDRLYVLHQNGAVDDQMWRGWESWIDYAFGTGDYFRQAWDANCAVYDPSFVRYIEERYGDGLCSPGVRTGAGRSSGTPVAAVP